jgi:hypothetical protein
MAAASANALKPRNTPVLPLPVPREDGRRGGRLQAEKAEKRKLTLPPQPTM